MDSGDSTDEVFNFAHLSLENAMICYAEKWLEVGCEEAWSIFKLFYPCKDTAPELFGKFFDEIIPRLENYDVVKENPHYNDKLKQIPIPKQPGPGVNVCIKWQFNLYDFTQCSIHFSFSFPMWSTYLCGRWNKKKSNSQNVIDF